MDSIIKHTETFLLKTLRLRKGDRRKVFALQSVIFLIITVLLILKSVFTGLLLSDYGIHIVPKAYVLIALTAVAGHLLLMKLGEGTDIYDKLQGNFLIQAAILFITGLIILQGWPGFSLLFYIYISLFALITVTYFYQYCQSILSIREAKRLLGHIGAGAIAGGIFGGYLASLLVNSIGNAGLVFLAVGLLLLTYVITRRLHAFEKIEPESKTKARTFTGLLYTLKHKHVVNIGFIIGLGVIVAKLADYQFNYLVAQMVHGSQDLTGYLGFWFSTINVVGLLIQLFLMNRIVDRMGVTRSMQILPVLILMATLLLLVFPILSIALVLKGVDGSLKQSVYKSTTELFTMPLPVELRGRAKSFVDVVVDSIATGLAGLMIIGLSSAVQTDLTAIGACTILIALAWMYFIHRGSSSYKNVLEDMVMPFQKYDERKEENSAERENWHKRVQEAIISIKAMRSNMINMAPEILSHFKLRGKRVIMSQIFDELRTPEELDKLFATLSHEDQLILTTTLASHVGRSERLRVLYNVEDKIDICIEILENKLIGEETEDKLYLQLYLAICYARYSEKYKLVRAALHSTSSIEKQKFALQAIQQTGLRKLYYEMDPEKIDIENQLVYYKTLAAFPAKTHALLKLLLEKNKDRFIAILPACRFIASQRNVDLLFNFLELDDKQIRRESLLALNEMKRQFPQFNYKKRLTERKLMMQLENIRKLITTRVSLKESSELRFLTGKSLNIIDSEIKNSLDNALMQVFIYLSLLTGRHDLEVIYKSVQQGNENKVLDFLDGILDYQLKSKVLPVLEALLIHEHTKANLPLIGVNDIYTLPRTYEYLKLLVGDKGSDSIGEIFRKAY